MKGYGVKMQDDRNKVERTIDMLVGEGVIARLLHEGGEQPNTYERERNKRIAKATEWLITALSERGSKQHYADALAYLSTHVPQLPTANRKVVKKTAKPLHEIVFVYVDHRIAQHIDNMVHSFRLAHKSGITVNREIDM